MGGGKNRISTEQTLNQIKASVQHTTVVDDVS